MVQKFIPHIIAFGLVISIYLPIFFMKNSYESILANDNLLKSLVKDGA